MKLQIASLWMAAAVAVTAQEASVVREGAYWVGSVGDSFPISVPSLRVNTRGDIVVRKAVGDQVTYRVRPLQPMADW